MEISVLYKLYLKYPVVCTDTRKNKDESIFFALRGDNYDGNQFAEEALRTGSALVIIDDPKFKKDHRYVLVKDTLKTLQELAQYHRKYLDIPVLAITGSNGKTTTKELCKNILSKKFHTVVTQGNLNNHIGVPQTILEATQETEILVVEMGANHRGEIARLCEIARPEYGIITNIGKAHLEGFGSIEGVISAKKELYEYISQHGTKVFVNSDNDLLNKLSSGLERITYGLNNNPDILGSNVEVDPFVSISINKKTSGGSYLFPVKIETNLIGQYNIENILAAVAVGNHFLIDMIEIKAAISEYKPENLRSQVMDTGINTIILDAYNANPTSMEYAIMNFFDLPGKNKVLILGDMMELGEATLSEHKNILSLIDKYKFSEVILVGDIFSSISTYPKYRCFRNTDNALDWLKNNPIIARQILIKASRVVGLEVLTEAL